LSDIHAGAILDAIYTCKAPPVKYNVHLHARRIRKDRSIKLSMSLVWLIFNLLKYAEETDDEVAAISHKTDPDKTNQDKLAVAYSVPHAAFKAR